jgi:D-Tyr-tRNAtyr deacylase
VANGSLQRVLVAEVDLHGDDLSEIAHDLQVAHIILVTVGDNDMGTRATYLTYEISGILVCQFSTLIAEAPPLSFER